MLSGPWGEGMVQGSCNQEKIRFTATFLGVLAMRMLDRINSTSIFHFQSQYVIFCGKVVHSVYILDMCVFSPEKFQRTHTKPKRVPFGDFMGIVK